MAVPDAVDSGDDCRQLQPVDFHEKLAASVEVVDSQLH